MSTLSRPIDWYDPVSDSPLNRGLVLWWLTGQASPFTGTPRFLDLLGRSHGTLANGPTWFGPMGRPGGFGALSFDGTDDQAFASNTPSLEVNAGSFAASVWFYANSFGSFKTVFAKSESSGNRDFGLFIDTTTTGYLNVNNVGDGISFSSAFTTGEWQMATLVRDTADNIARVYRNGVQVSSLAASNTTSLSQTLKLGFDWPSGGGGVWNGLLDSFRLYNRALTADEVRALHDDSRAGYQQTLRRTKRTWFVNTAGGGGNLINRTAADTPTVSESITRSLELPRTASDNPSVSSSVTAVGGQLRTASDSPTVSEAVTRLFVGARSLADNPSSSSTVRANSPQPSDLSGLIGWYVAEEGKYDATSGGSPVTADAAAIARWEDQSEENNHVTQATSARRCVWDATRELVVSETYLGATQWFDCPANFDLNRRDFTVAIIGEPSSFYAAALGAGAYPEHFVAGSSGDALNLFWQNTGILSAYDGATEEGDTTVVVPSNRCLMVWVGTASALKLWVNGTKYETTALDSGTATINAIMGYAATNIGQSQIGCKDYIVYNRALLDSEVEDTLLAYAQNERGVEALSDRRIYFIGDSITHGYGATVNRTIAQRTGLAEFFAVFVMAKSGATLTDLNNDLATCLTPLLNPGDICVVFAGTNDIAGGANAATTESRLETLCNAIKTAEPLARILIVTCLPRITGGATTYESYRQLQISGYSDYADALYDWDDTAPELADPTDTDYYLADAIHLNDAGTALIADGIGDAVLAMFQIAATAVDTPSSADDVTRSLGLPRTAADAPTASESVTRAVVGVRSTGDSPSVAESVSRLLVGTRSVTDAPSVSEAAARILSLVRYSLDLTTDLAGYWPMTEPSGNAINALGVSADDLLEFGTVGSNDGGRRVSIPGNFFYHPDSATFSVPNTSFTFAFWLRIIDDTGEVRLFDKEDSTEEYGLVVSSIANRIYWNVHGADGIAEALAEKDFPYSLNTWYFIQAWFDATTNTAYVTYDLEAPGSAVLGQTVRDGTSTFGMPFGGQSIHDYSQFGLWKRALTDRERSTLYNGGTRLSYAEFLALGNAPFVTDSVSRLLSATYTASDGPSVSEEVGQVSGQLATAADAPSVTEVVSRAVAAPRTLVDGPSVAETVSRLLVAARTAADAPSVSSVVSGGTGPITIITISLDGIVQRNVAGSGKAQRNIGVTGEAGAGS